MRRKLFRIGTRGSALALAQTALVRRALERRHPGLRFRTVVVRTAGDLRRDLSVFDHGATGAFTREIERRLLRGGIDFAVHSLKDLPTRLVPGLALAACLRREDPRDVILSRSGKGLGALRPFARVGTSSPRRKAELLRARPDLRIVPVRGNLTTRARFVREGRLDAVVVARAGLRRLGRPGAARPIALSEALPCVAQGVLAVEARAADREVLRLLEPLNDPPTASAARAERTLLAALGGGCRVPLGALARHTRGGRMRLEASVFATKGGGAVSGALEGPAASPERLGRRLARLLRARGAGGLLREARPR